MKTIFKKRIFRLLALALHLMPAGIMAQNTLNAYLSQAILNSPLITDQKNQVKALALDSIRILATYKPQVNFTGNGFYAPVIHGYGYDEILTNGQLLSTLVGVNYSLPGKNRLNNQFSSLQLQKQTLELNTKLGVRDLEQAVTAQYITVFAEQQNLSSIRAILGIMKKEEKILKSFTEQSIYAETDYLAFLSTQKQQELSVSQQYLQTQSDLFLLKYLCGITDTAYYELNKPDLVITEPRKGEQTAQYFQYHLDSLQISNSIEQFQLTYKPKLNLFGDAGYMTSFAYQPYKNFGTSVGVNLTVPIYDGNQRKMQLEKFRLSEETRSTYAVYFTRQFSIKQQQLLKQIRETDRIIEEAGKQIEIAETVLKANNLLLEAGNLKVSDYILSVTGLISAKESVKQLEAGKMQLINQFIYLNY